MDTFRLSIRRFSGCENGNECHINLPNGQFDSNSKYLLIQGSMNVEYMGQGKNFIDTPYTSTGWMNYIDSWNYSRSVSLTTKPPKTQFLIVTLNSLGENTPLESLVSVCNISNASVTKSANTQSYFFVIGESFIVDGQTAARQKTVKIDQARDVTISSSGECSILYVEKA